MAGEHRMIQFTNILTDLLDQTQAAAIKCKQIAQKYNYVFKTTNRQCHVKPVIETMLSMLPLICPTVPVCKGEGPVYKNSVM